jgi:hypothetical protein
MKLSRFAKLSCRTAHSLVPIGGYEQPHCPPEDMCGIDQGLCAPTSVRRHLGTLLAEFASANKPKFTGTYIAAVALHGAG